MKLGSEELEMLEELETLVVELEMLERLVNGEEDAKVGDWGALG